MLNVRYPPYTDAKLSQFLRSSALKPNFDREGKEVRGLGYWVGLVTSLGGESVKSVLVRWVVLALFAVGSKRVWEGKFGNGLPGYLR